jgi:hypothetical protein
LKHLRNESEALTLRVDPISINQNDIAERDAQDLLMRNIYESAQEVISWLGIPSIDINPIHDLLQELKRADDGELDVMSIGTSVMEPTQIPKWRAVFHVFGSEYWLRVWIMHEVVCARHVIIRSGEHTFRWLDIGRMALIICFFSSVVSAIPELTTAASWTAATVGNLISLHQRRNMVVNADGEPLLGLLTAARRHKSTDWRDRVYSLLRISDITMNVITILMQTASSWRLRERYPAVEKGWMSFARPGRRSLEGSCRLGVRTGLSFIRMVSNRSESIGSKRVEKFHLEHSCHSLRMARSFPVRATAWAQ